MSTPDTKERVLYTVTFVTAHSAITTNVELDNTEDEDYILTAASELVSEELGLGTEILDLAQDTSIERWEN